MSNLIVTNNPTIIAAIIGAILGSFLTWCLAYFTEKRRFNKRKNGAKTILKSEIRMNINNLKNYEKNHLKKTSQDLSDIGNLNDIYAFYRSLDKFPVLSHDNWDKLIDFIPYVFEDNDIKQILEFNARIDQLNISSEILSAIDLKEINFSGFYLFELETRELRVTLGNYTQFKNSVQKTIEYGVAIKNFADF